jgi:oxygen-independent coproporphyrinogen-3 oxidase
MMLGVRRREGLSFDDVSSAARERVPQMVTWGLLDPAAHRTGRLVLTQRGRLLADAVVRDLID